jgi:nitroreductase
MELQEAIRKRRMVRAFRPDPVPAAALERVLHAARRAPSAGFTQGLALVVLEGAEQTSSYWASVTTHAWRTRSSRWPGLSSAPVVLIPLANRQAYLDRYSEPDKASSGLSQAEAWPVPYWLVDAAFATMAVLLAAVDEGLGAVFQGIWRGEAELLARLGVPAGWKPIGAVVLGWPDPAGDHPSPSLSRGRRPRGEVIHRGRW